MWQKRFPEAEATSRAINESNGKGIRLMLTIVLRAHALTQFSQSRNQASAESDGHADFTLSNSLYIEDALFKEDKFNMEETQYRLLSI